MSLEELAASAPYRDSDGYMHMEQIKELTQTMKTTRLEFLPDTDLIADARRVRDKLRYCYTHKKLNILFLGMPGVGKSTLINRCVSQSYVNSMFFFFIMLTPLPCLSQPDQDKSDPYLL